MNAVEHIYYTMHDIVNINREFKNYETNTLKTLDDILKVDNAKYKNEVDNIKAEVTEYKNEITILTDFLKKKMHYCQTHKRYLASIKQLNKQIYKYTQNCIQLQSQLQNGQLNQQEFDLSMDINTHLINGAKYQISKLCKLLGVNEFNCPRKKLISVWSGSHTVLETMEIIMDKCILRLKIVNQLSLIISLLKMKKKMK